MQQFMRSNALSPMVMVCTDRSSRGMDFDRAEASFFFFSDASTRWSNRPVVQWYSIAVCCYGRGRSFDSVSSNTCHLMGLLKHCRQALQSSIAVKHCSQALQSSIAVKHCSQALQSSIAVKHCDQPLQLRS